MSEAFIGEIRMVGFGFAPRGWAFCNGQLLSISQNTAVFSLLGTTYGGNGQTTFALPNLQSRVARHVGQGPGLAPVQWGEVGGSENTTLQLSQMPNHAHGVSLHAETAISDSANPTGRMLALSGNNNIYAAPAPANDINMASQSIRENTVGGSQPFSLLNPYLGIYFIICLQGIFPSRN